jgi:hypothetical protein
MGLQFCCIKILLIVKPFGMKIKSMFFTAVICLIAASLNAQQTGQLKLAVEQPDNAVLKFKVHVANPENQKVALYVTEKNEGPLAVQSFTTNNFSVVFDLSSLQDGEYTIEARAGKEKLERKIVISTFSRVERIASVNNEKRSKILAF